LEIGAMLPLAIEPRRSNGRRDPKISLLARG
jgi:hypothetical protein